MAGRSGRPWFAAAAAVLLLGLATMRHGSTTATPEPPQPSGSRTGAPAPAPTPTRTAASGYDPARYAAEVRRHARQAGIHPQLLMAILYNESYKPHDPALERAWQRLKPDSAFGIANMHRAAFDDTKKGRPFAGRTWEELPDDPDLAVESAAWYLHDLARQLPARHTGPYTEDQLLALGYNTGPATMRAFARGATPGSQAGSYLAQLKENWTRAAKALEPGG